jgi:hypothetical protein
MASTALACAEAKIENAGSYGGSGPGGFGQQGGAGGGGGGGGQPIIDLDAAVSGPDLRKDDLPPDLTGCRQDDAGGWTCCPEPMSILSLGLPAKFGAGSGSQDSTTAFMDFINNNTSGTAKMVMQTTFTSLNERLLADYDLVILQFMGQDVYTDYGIWKFQQSDADALKQWVTEKGGAVIAMSGYSGQIAEVTPLNQLMAPFGISYNSDDLFNESDCPDGLCYCSYGSIPFNHWLDTKDCSSITTNSNNTPLGKVGIFKGRSINCTAADCNVFAKHPKSGANVGVATSG